MATDSDDNKIRSRCRDYLESFYQKPIAEIAKLDIEDEELLDFGDDVGDEDLSH